MKNIILSDKAEQFAGYLRQTGGEGEKSMIADSMSDLAEILEAGLEGGSELAVHATKIVHAMSLMANYNHTINLLLQTDDAIDPRYVIAEPD